MLNKELYEKLEQEFTLCRVGEEVEDEIGRASCRERV